MADHYSVRDTTPADQKVLEKLFHSPTIRFFGNMLSRVNNIKSFFTDYQAQRLSAIDVDGDLIAYAEFRDYPDLTALPSDCWLNWLKFHYCLSMPITLLNTMFMNFCVYKIDCADAIRELVKAIFLLELRVEFIIVVKPSTLESKEKFSKEEFDDIEAFGQVFFPRVFSLQSCPNTQSLLVINADEVLAPIIYRKALPEDNDDIIELLDFEVPTLREDLGDYYIAEELLRGDINDKESFLIVAEFENAQKQWDPSGFLWLNENINIRLYVKNYELENFGNLVTWTDGKAFVRETIHVTKRKKKTSSSLFTDIALKCLKEHTILGGLQVCESDTTVASISVMRLQSIDGHVIIPPGHDFFDNEQIYLKMKYIFQELRKSDYYVKNESHSFDFLYNIDDKSPVPSKPNDTANVFQIKYCVIHPKYSMPLLFRFLIGAFSAYPERDYAIIAVPKSGIISPCLNELLRYFMLVNHWPSASFQEEDLYIVHRSSIQGELSVYSLQREDIPDIYVLLNLDQPSSHSSSSLTYATINQSEDVKIEEAMIEYVIDDVLNNPKTEYTVLTFRCGNSAMTYNMNTFVGFVVLRHFMNYRLLHHNFQLPHGQNHLWHVRAEIILLKLHPFYHIWSDSLFRSISRKTGFFDFLYIKSRRVFSFSNDLTKNMMPIEPHIRKKYWNKYVDTKVTDNLCKKLNLPTPNFETGYMEVYRYTLRPSKYYGNTSNLVILGFTAIARAFLRQLVFMRNCKSQEDLQQFNYLPNVRITVIAYPGIVEAAFDTKYMCPLCDDTPNCYLTDQNNSAYIRDVTARMDLRNWVHFISDYPLSIDRENKTVTLMNSCEIKYETLLLLNYTKFALKKDMNFIVTPFNMVQINNRLDKIMLVYKVRLLMEEKSKKFRILIYGSNLEAYECINFLLSHGVPAQRIFFACPYQQVGTATEVKQKIGNSDRNIQYLLEAMVKDLGVNLYENYNFYNYEQFPMKSFITNVLFYKFPDKELFKVPCDLFINFEEGALSMRDRLLCRESGIEMRNSSVVIDENYRTNDENIYAMGRHVYMTGEPNHQYVNTSPRESARKLMHILKLRTNSSKPYEHKYRLPTFFQARLPLNHFITKIVLPARYLCSQLDEEHCCCMTTYHDFRFVRVKISPRRIVEEIVCIAKSSTQLDFLLHFCGQHEAMLNNLLARYRRGSITCFLNFFKEPWTELIMHENFERMQEENHKLLRPLVEATLQYKKDLSKAPTMAQKEMLKMNKNLLEQSLLTFLRNNRKDFLHEVALPEDFYQYAS